MANGSWSPEYNSARVPTLLSRHAEIHRTSDNDERKSQCPINVGKTLDKMSGISIYPKFVVKSRIFLWFHNELTSSITSSWSKVNKSAIIPETLILPNLPSWLKISLDFPYLWRHIHVNPQHTFLQKGGVFRVSRVFSCFFLGRSPHDVIICQGGQAREGQSLLYNLSTLFLLVFQLRTQITCQRMRWKTLPIIRLYFKFDWRYGTLNSVLAWMAVLVH